MKQESLVIAGQPYGGESAPGPCTYRPSHYRIWSGLKSLPLTRFSESIYNTIQVSLAHGYLSNSSHCFYKTSLLYHQPIAHRLLEEALGQTTNKNFTKLPSCIIKPIAYRLLEEALGTNNKQKFKGCLLASRSWPRHGMARRSCRDQNVHHTCH